MASGVASVAPPAVRKVPGNFQTPTAIATAERTIAFEMEYTASDTKVQIRLSTRDAGLQIAEEPTVLLVQTCRFNFHARNQPRKTRNMANPDCRILSTLADILDQL